MRYATFIADNYPAEMRVPNPETDLTKEQSLLWHRILYRKGWIAPLWPKEYGGPGWTITQRYIFEQETSRAGTLPPLAFGVTMVGPVIYTFGNDAQKKKFLPRILSGDDWWCQGYSEPGAGSDLASLRTKAVRDGDHYIVNGHKTWTTLAQHADWIFCLVRTDPQAKPQSGISFLLIDMKTPGDHRAADHHDRRQPRGQRCLSRRRSRAGRQPDRRREQGLDLRQVPARQRAHQHGRHRPLEAPPREAQEHRPRRACRPTIRRRATWRKTSPRSRSI